MLHIYNNVVFTDKTKGNGRSGEIKSPANVPPSLSLNFEPFQGHMIGLAQAPAKTCVSISRSVPEDGQRF